MPKPILKPPQTKTQNDFELQIKQKQSSTLEMSPQDKMRLDRLLRKARSKQYMSAVKQLDSGGHVCNDKQVKEIIDAINNEFPEVKLPDIMLGIVAKCYLGENFEAHTLDFCGGIIKHFRQGHKLDEGMEKARGIAMHGGYEFIEVYTDCCRAISSDGSVSVIR